MARRHLEGDGRRARIGIVVPSVNTVMEPWAQKVVPDGVSIFAARMFIPPATTPEAFIEMDRNEGKAAIRQLSSVFPDAIAYGCTASSIVQGLAYDAHLRAEIERDLQGAVDHRRARHPDRRQTLGVATVSIVSPYTKEVDEAEHRYFAGAGLDGRGRRLPRHRRWLRARRARARHAVRAGHARLRHRADGLIMTCLNTRSHTVIDRLEQELGKPVITSTQATLWHALRLAGIDDRIKGYGRLLDG